MNGAAGFVGYYTRYGMYLQYFQPEKAKKETTSSRKVQLDTEQISNFKLYPYIMLWHVVC